MLLKVVGLSPKAGGADPEDFCLEHRSKWLSNACLEAAAVLQYLCRAPTAIPVCSGFHKFAGKLL